MWLRHWDHLKVSNEISSQPTRIYIPHSERDRQAITIQVCPWDEFDKRQLKGPTSFGKLQKKIPRVGDERQMQGGER